MDVPYDRLAEQVGHARALFPDARTIQPCWKPSSERLDVGVTVILPNGRGKVLSFRPDGQVIR